MGLSSVFFDRVFDFMAVLLIMAGLLLFAPYLELPTWTTSVIYGAYILAIILSILIIIIIKNFEIIKTVIGPNLKNLKKFENAFDEFQEAFRLIC